MAETDAKQARQEFHDGRRHDPRRAGDMAGEVGWQAKRRPSGDVTATRWRYSLMNWGHDPLK